MHANEIAEKLRSCELRFRRMAEAINDVYFLVDARSGGIAYISPAYAEIWGRSGESAQADPASWAEAIHPEDRAAACVSYGDGLSGSEAMFEHRIVRPDGSVRWIEAKHIPVRDDAGHITSVTRVATDITERKRISLALRESMQCLDGIVNSAMDAIVRVDDGHRIVLANAAAVQMFGYAPGELLGQPLGMLIPSRFQAAHPTQVATFGASGKTSRRMGSLRTVTGLRKNGEEFMIEVSISRDESSGQRLFTAILRDVTEQQQAEAKIRRLNRVYALHSQINTLIVRARDRDELFREACRIAVELGGFYMAFVGIEDRSTQRIVPVAWAGGDEQLLAFIEGALASGEVAPKTMVARAIREKTPAVSNNSQHDSRVALTDKYAKSGIHSMAALPLVVADAAIGTLVLYSREAGFFHEDEMRLLMELTGEIAFAIDHIEKAERLGYLACFDVLTGLANQSLFVERLQQKLLSLSDEPGKTAVFLIDIERFKTINDTFGRSEGDGLLKQIAERLVRIGGGDAGRFARFGVDRFGVVASGFDSVEQVGNYLEQRLAANFRTPFRVADSDLRVSVKAGVALFPDDGADADTLLRHAEAALKKAKATGERYLFFNQKMTERVAERLSLENRLRQGLDNGEFVLHYQPKVRLGDGKLTGAEALIRWNDSQTGLVPPGMFIPILEETGLIHEVGRWAMRKAIEDYLRWRNAGLPAVRIAVNVSPLQLRNRSFIADVEQALGSDARAAVGLELEITESVIMEEVEQKIALLQAIRAIGVTIAIDDFGTGFSSLSYLSKLPVDTLKIDRAFVVDMTAGPDGLALVSTIIRLAHSLNLKVVAEGVETEEQSRLLRLLNCEEMQGYLYSKPVPCEVFEARFLMPAARAT